MAVAHDFRFQETSKFGGGDGVEAARRFVEEQDSGTMKKSACQAEALNGSGGKCAHLAVERFAEVKLFSELRDSLGCGGARELI